MALSENHFTISFAEFSKYQPSLIGGQDDVYLVYPSWSNNGFYIAPIHSGGYAIFDCLWKTLEKIYWDQEFKTLSEAFAYCR